MENNVNNVNNINKEDNEKNIEWCIAFDEKYTFLIKLGVGAFGSVWKLQEKHVPTKLYAVKIEEKSQKSRLKNEYKIYKIFSITMLRVYRKLRNFYILQNIFI